MTNVAPLKAVQPQRRKRASPADPLLAALIAKLPPSGSEWPAQARQDWLGMMTMAFSVVYGAVGVVGPSGALTAWHRDLVDDSKPNPFGSSPESRARFQEITESGEGYDYFIDSNGYARRATDRGRVHADAIPADEIIYDYRRGPLRDRETIVWADESMGAIAGMNFCGPG